MKSISACDVQLLSVLVVLAALLRISLFSGIYTKKNKGNHSNPQSILVFPAANLDFWEVIPRLRLNETIQSSKLAGTNICLQ